MKRSVGPGQQIPLDELYNQYGARHDLEEGEEFIQWLNDVKLRDTNKWQIFDKDKPSKRGEVSPDEPREIEEAQGSSTKVRVDKSKGENVAPPVTSDLQVEDVVGLSVRKARELMPSIQDLQLLKYAENIARQRAGKDSLRLVLMKRIEELSILTRR